MNGILKKKNLWLNENYFQLIGIENKKDFYVFDDYLKFIHQDDKHELINQIENLSSTINNYISIEYRLLLKDNYFQNFIETACFVRGRGGKPIKKIASIRNVTHWKKHINQLETILFDLSHKIRQPICNILGIAYLFDNKLVNEIEQTKALNFIKDAANMLDKYTGEMTKLITDYKNNSNPKSVS